MLRHFDEDRSLAQSAKWGGKRALYQQVKVLCAEGITWRLVPEHGRPELLAIEDDDYRARPTLRVGASASTKQIFKRSCLTTIGDGKSWIAMDRLCQACALQINDAAYDVLLTHPCRLFRVTSIGRHVTIPKSYTFRKPYRPLYEAMPRLPWIAQPSTRTDGWSFPTLSVSCATRSTCKLTDSGREELLNGAEAFDTILVNSHFQSRERMRGLWTRCQGVLPRD
jgi:hypothetical protein